MMNILETVRSKAVKEGAEFGKSPTGPWFKMLPDGSFQCTSMPSGKSAPTMHSRGLTLFAADFDLGTWQLRPERVAPVTAKEFMGRVDTVLNMLRALITELVEAKNEPGA